MSTCELYSDVSAQGQFRWYATVYIYDQQEYWEVSQCPLPREHGVPDSEVAAVTRGLLRAYARIPPEVPISAFTDIDCVPDMLQRRRFKGRFGGVVQKLYSVVTQRDNVTILKAPRTHWAYRQCHSRARTALKQQVKRAPYRAFQQTSIQPLRTRWSGVLQLAYDLGQTSVIDPDEMRRSEANVMLTLLKQRYSDRFV